MRIVSFDDSVKAKPFIIMRSVSKDRSAHAYNSSKIEKHIGFDASKNITRLIAANVTAFPTLLNWTLETKKTPLKGMH